MKKSAKLLRKPSSEPGLVTPNRPPNIKCIVPAFFGDRFGEKKGGLYTVQKLNRLILIWACLICVRHILERYSLKKIPTPYKTLYYTAFKSQEIWSIRDYYI